MLREIAFILCLMFALPAFAAEPHEETAYDRVIRTGVIKCGVMLWPPYFEMDLNTNKIKGFGVDFYNAIARLLDIDISYVEIVVGQQVEDLNQGKIDAVCNDGPYVFSAMKFVDYTDPAYFGPVYIHVRADETAYTTPEDMNEKSVRFVGMDGDLSADLVARNYPDATLQTLPATADAASLMMQVTTKKADAVIIDPAPVKGFNETNPPGLKALFTDRPIVYPIGMSVKKGEQELLNMLNSGIHALWNTNGAMPILKKYDPDGEFFLPLAKPYGTWSE